MVDLNSVCEKFDMNRLNYDNWKNDSNLIKIMI